MYCIVVFFFFASLYLSYLQVFHIVQMLPLSLANAANVSLQVLSICLLQCVSCKCWLPLSHANTACQYVSCKSVGCQYVSFHSCMCLTCDCCQCCCSYIFWTVSSHRASESLSLQNKLVVLTTEWLPWL